MNRPPSIRIYLGSMVLALSSLACGVSLAATSGQINLALSGGNDITIQRYPASGNQLILWLAPDFGLRPGHREMAEMLSRNGTEVWLADLIEVQFLERGSSGMRAINPELVADIIEQTHARTGKDITVAAEFYAGIPALRGVHAWQQRKPASAYMKGVILFSPHLFRKIPGLGEEPDYMSIVDATNVPIFIFQGAKNGTLWQLPKLTDRLRRSGSKVFVESMPGINSLFFDEHRSAELDTVFQQMPKKIVKALSLLAQIPAALKPRTLTDKPQSVGRGLDLALRPFKGKFAPFPIQLTNSEGKRFNISDYHGGVTVINFWATWCPPCVGEIPSLNRLREAMQGENFHLISINYAEDAGAVRAFMQRVQVDFPVLLDHDGQEAAKWKVLAMPSTFVIGTDGQIHYGVNAAIEWDAPEVIATMKKLAHPE